MPEWDLSQPTRQNILGVVIYILRNFRVMVSLFITLLIVGAAKPQIWIIIGIAVIPVAVLLALLAYWQYRNFTFHIEGDDLIIHKGVIFKDRTVISADRIQSIKIVENIVQRILGLVALKVDTAGSSGAELEIPALERKAAMALKDLLYRKKEEAEGGTITAESDGHSETASDGEARTAEPKENREPVEKRVLVKLSLFDLVLVGLTENHLKTGLVALAVVFGYFSQLIEYFENYLEEYVDEYATAVANASITFALTALVLYAIISVLISLVRTFLRFYGLKAQLEPEAIEIETGLLKRSYDRVPVRKVQFVEWETNPLRRLVGFESARIHPTNPVGAANKQKVEIPALRPVQSAQLADGIYPGYAAPIEGFKANAAAYARISAIVLSFGLLPLTAVAFYEFGTLALGLLAIYLPILFFSWQFGRRVRICFDRQFLLVRKGWVFPSRMVLPLHKLQSVAVSSNIFLKRRGLCHLNLYTAAGSRSVRYLSEKDAAELSDYLLWCVERSEEDWM